MKWKLNEAEIKEFCDSLKPCFANAHTLVIKCSASHDFVTEALPPGFVPVDDAVTFSFTWSDAFIGSVAGIPAKYGEKTGTYGLAYMMSRDTEVIYGRELWGEPKKLADQPMSKDGNEIDVAIKRFGIELLKAHGTIVKEADPKMFARTEALHTKYFLKSDGSGVEDAKVVYNLFTNEVKCAYFCKATLEQTPSDYDIFGSIPVGDIQYACYFESDMYPVGEDIGTIPGDQMLPYVYQRHDPYCIILPKNDRR